jgi:hypothetical protein
VHEFFYAMLTASNMPKNGRHQAFQHVENATPLKSSAAAWPKHQQSQSGGWLQVL